jgi:hypothetical protein
MPLVDDPPHRPALVRNQARLLVPSIVDESIFVGELLPVADFVVVDPRLENQVVIAADGLQRVELNAPETVKDLPHAAGPEVIGSQRPAYVGFGEGERHGSLLL